MFISKGQHTNYLQRFNVNPYSEYETYTHQYMTNIAGAASESANNYKAYTNNNLIKHKKIFWIPVYENYQETKASFNLTNHTGTVLKDVFLKSGAGMSYKDVVKLKKGSKVQILEGTLFEEEYNAASLIYPYFYKIKYKDKEGYIYVGDVKIDNEINLSLGEKKELEYSGENVLIQSSNRRSVDVVDNSIVANDIGTSEIRIFAGTSMDAITVNVK